MFISNIFSSVFFFCLAEITKQVFFTADGYCFFFHFCSSVLFVLSYVLLLFLCENGRGKVNTFHHTRVHNIDILAWEVIRQSIFLHFNIFRHDISRKRYTKIHKISLYSQSKYYFRIIFCLNLKCVARYLRLEIRDRIECVAWRDFNL